MVAEKYTMNDFKVHMNAIQNQIQQMKLTLKENKAEFDKKIETLKPKVRTTKVLQNRRASDDVNMPALTNASDVETLEAKSYVDNHVFVSRQVLQVEPKLEPNVEHREHIFQTRCMVGDKVLSCIVDSGSCTNALSVLAAEKLSLPTTPHPNPYRLRWLNDREDLWVDKQAQISIVFGGFKDEVLCDIVPMHTCHILLGRPWQFDRRAKYDAYANTYTVSKGKQVVLLKPLPPALAHEDQAKISKECKEREEKELREKQAMREKNEAARSRERETKNEIDQSELKNERRKENELQIVTHKKVSEFELSEREIKESTIERKAIEEECEEKIKDESVEEKEHLFSECTRKSEVKRFLLPQSSVLTPPNSCSSVVSFVQDSHRDFSKGLPNGSSIIMKVELQLDAKGKGNSYLFEDIKKLFEHDPNIVIVLDVCGGLALEKFCIGDFILLSNDRAKSLGLECVKALFAHDFVCSSVFHASKSIVFRPFPRHNNLLFREYNIHMFKGSLCENCLLNFKLLSSTRFGKNDSYANMLSSKCENFFLPCATVSLLEDFKNNLVINSSFQRHVLISKLNLKILGFECNKVLFASYLDSVSILNACRRVSFDKFDNHDCLLLRGNRSFELHNFLCKYVVQYFVEILAYDENLEQLQLYERIQHYAIRRKVFDPGGWMKEDM